MMLSAPGTWLHHPSKPTQGRCLGTSSSPTRQPVGCSRLQRRRRVDVSLRSASGVGDGESEGSLEGRQDAAPPASGDSGLKEAQVEASGAWRAPGQVVREGFSSTATYRGPSASTSSQPSGGGVKEPSPILSWDKDSSPGPAGIGGWDEAKERRRPSWLGNALFGAAVLLAAVAAGGLFGQLRQRRLQASLAPPPAVVVSTGRPMPSLMERAQRRLQAQQWEQQQAQQGEQQQQQQQREGEVTKSTAGGTEGLSEVSPSASGVLDRQEEAGRAEQAQQGPEHSQGGSAAKEGQHETPVVHTPEGLAALARIRDFQAQHLKEVAEHAQQPQQAELVQQGERAGTAKQAQQQPPAGASSLAPFAGDAQSSWSQLLGGEPVGSSFSPPPAAAGAVGVSEATGHAEARLRAVPDTPAEPADVAAVTNGLDLGVDSGRQVLPPLDESAVSTVDTQRGQQQDEARSLSEVTHAAKDEAAAAAEEAEPAAGLPEGTSLEALAVRAEEARKAAAAAAKAAQRAADASVVAAESAQRAAQHAQQATSAAARAQSALNLHADDAVEDALKRVREAETAAARAAEEAAAAAKEGATSEGDAARQSRRAAAAAEAQKRPPATEKVAAWWEGSQQAVASSLEGIRQGAGSAAQQAQQAIGGAAQQAGQGLGAAAQRVGQGFGSVAQQAQQATASGPAGRAQHALAGAAQHTQQAAAGLAQQAQHALAGVGPAVQSWQGQGGQWFSQLRSGVSGLAMSASQSAQAAWAGLKLRAQEAFRGKY